MPLVNVIQLSKEKCSIPIQAKLKYATPKNFVGRPIKGYDSKITNIAFMTPQAAEALCQVQNYLIKEHDYGLRIYDAYRPQRAVTDFLFWSQQPPASLYELKRKEKHYPNIPKNRLFELGYMAEDSSHCYGNTVDLVLINIKTGKKLEMGARFDYMDEASHVTAPRHQIGEEAYQNRRILSNAMKKFDFESLKEEFWHFSHRGKSGREVSKPLDIEITPQMQSVRFSKL
jgi:zinc D-Ala-D-Ala dipeptidase